MNHKSRIVILNISIVALIYSYTVFSQSIKDKDFAEVYTYSSLVKYVGIYPCEREKTDFFKNILVINELKKVLKKDFKNYITFIKHAGCGKIEIKDSILISDNSYMHVGGYNSIIFFDIPNKKTYLFWLNSTVWDKKVKIYGDRPIPITVQRYLEKDLNQGWGHVAKFQVLGDSVCIELK